jgi:hypothetical protein
MGPDIGSLRPRLRGFFLFQASAGHLPFSDADLMMTPLILPVVGLLPLAPVAYAASSFNDRSISVSVKPGANC